MTDVADSLGTVGDSLGTKVGPLPVWAWAGMAAAGVSAAILIRRRMRGGSTPDAEAPEPGIEVDGSSTPSPFLPGGFVIGGGATQATGSTGPADTPTAPERPRTNSDWQIDAQRFLIGRGYQGTVVTDALARFLSGRPLTPQGAAIIDAAIAAVGAPPQPVPPPTVSPTPEPVPSPGGGGSTPAKPAARGTTVVSKTDQGTELYGLVQAAWGRPPSRPEWRTVAAANGLTVYRPDPARDFESVRPWRKGLTVTIPPRP